MKKRRFILAGLSLFSALASAEGQVTVHLPRNQNSIVIDRVKNLAQLMTQPALMPYSHGAVIAERSATAVAQQHYQQTLAKLRAWRADSSSDSAAAIDDVIRQLQAINVTGRQFTPLDPDWIRLHPTDNRRLEGHYDLYLSSQPDSVLLLGALAGAGKVRWQPGQSVRHYLADHARLANAERDFATVISPSGATRQVPIAYWNHRHVEVEPGSIIWLGFSSWSLPAAFDDLNSRILSVLTHRIPD